MLSHTQELETDETPMKPLTSLEDATMRYVLAHASEGGGWLDLTRICSDTGRMLADVRQSVARLARRKILIVDEHAPNTDRWIRFVVPGSQEPVSSEPPKPAP